MNVKLDDLGKHSVHTHTFLRLQKAHADDDFVQLLIHTEVRP